MTGLLYQRLKNHCDADDIPVARFVTDLLCDHLDKVGAPVETILRPGHVRRVEGESAHREF